MKTIRTLIAAGAVLALAGPALAQKAIPDANGDGKVTLSEFQASRGAQMFTRLDASKDGKISKDEFAAVGQMGEGQAGKAGKRGQRMWGMFDSDKDGFLSRAEVDAMLAKRFQRMDSDNDGALSAEELKAGAGKAKVGI